MGKNRNRKKRTAYKRINFKDLNNSPGNGKPPEDGRRSCIKIDTKFPEHSEKSCKNIPQEKAIGNSSSFKSESAQMKCSDQMKNLVEDHANEVVIYDLSSPDKSSRFQAEIPPLKGEGTRFEKIKKIAKFSAVGDIKNLPSEVKKHEAEISINSDGINNKTMASCTHSCSLTKNSGRDVQSDFRVQAQEKNRDSFYSGLDNAISLVQSETRSVSNVGDGNGNSSYSPVKSHVFGEESTFQSKANAGKSATPNRKVSEENTKSPIKTLVPYESFAHRTILEWDDFFGQTSEQKCSSHKGYNRRDGQNSTAKRDANINGERGDISYPAIKSCPKLRENAKTSDDTLNRNVLQQKTVIKGNEMENGGNLLELVPTQQKKPSVVRPRGIAKTENGSSSSYCENNFMQYAPDGIDVYGQQLKKKQVKYDFPFESNESHHTRSNRKMIENGSSSSYCENNSLKKAPGDIDVYSQQFKKKQVKSNFPSESRNESHYTRSNSLYTSTPAGEPEGNPKKLFRMALNRWLSVRNESIQKLRKLLDIVPKNEAFFDSIQLNCKYGSMNCKIAKVSPVAPTWTWELATSVGSMFCDMAGGLTSVAHMFNTNGIQSEFQQIMDTDANATKEMYDARSKYVAEYNYTDEIIRKFGGTTLGETLGKISEAVGITEFFHKMKKANDNREDIVVAAVSALYSIIDRNCSRYVGREVVDAVQELVDSNPACVGTVAGIGKSLYGAADLRMIPLKRAGKVGALVRAGTRVVDTMLVEQEKTEIDELERKLEFGSESTVERNIRTALEMFIEEQNEMLKLLSKL